MRVLPRKMCYTCSRFEEASPQPPSCCPPPQARGQGVAFLGLLKGSRIPPTALDESFPSSRSRLLGFLVGVRFCVNFSEGGVVWDVGCGALHAPQLHREGFLCEKAWSS